MEIQNKESDLEFVGEIFNKDSSKEHEEALQRSEVWFEQRRGNWTGSQFKSLMTSNSKGSKIPWNAIEKTYMISSGALKYIFSNVMERKTGRYITNDSTKEMKYGTKIEPLIFKAANALLKEKGLYLELVGFKLFDEIPTAGVSSDAIVKSIETDEIVGSCEMKACSSWTTFFERTFEKLNETGKDFWQTQGQMLAWNVEKNYYIVAEPVQDISRYLYYNGDVMDLYDEWLNETAISIDIVEISPIHTKALLKRIEIAESVVLRTLEEGIENLKDIFYEQIDEFKTQVKNLDSEEYETEPEPKKEPEPELEIEKVPVLEKEITEQKTFAEISNDLPF